MNKIKQKSAAVLPSIIFGVVLLGVWQILVTGLDISPFILPAPSDIAHALRDDWYLLFPSFVVTMKITVIAYGLALLLGGLLALIFSLSRWVESGLYPYAVILQVTPVSAIAPLLIIWTNDVFSALLICAWLVAFFPILSNTVMGLNSVDRNLNDLFLLYGATKYQRLRYLRIPSASPYFLAGAQISGGLALIGTVVAEFVAGKAGAGSGLAFRILEAGYQLKVSRMFAALLLICFGGVGIFLLTRYLSRLLLARWHESAR